MKIHYVIYKEGEDHVNTLILPPITTKTMDHNTVEDHKEAYVQTVQYVNVKRLGQDQIVSYQRHSMILNMIHLIHGMDCNLHHH